ncbi:plasma membrane localization protein [Entomortierella chlamydospora]|uniref:Plasma membrane localization protein n=1 Tax=Entomortierella chlamydospora TaxID=101097 RepID=A0A9P6MXX5_9FUNG|nr:plasma membrane localization protein [Entomortierella chlamydospora]KAG0016435.1 plasma membrane localization protein [Entomortierella chlamydospora]
MTSIYSSYPTSRSRSASVSASSAHGSLFNLDPNANANTPLPPPLPPVPQSVATHSSFIPTRYVKHATLINNCYPARPDEKGPKSSELSYLVFYSTSKPAKLTKVCTFIERRTVRDFRKKRFNDVHCSLEIIKELLLANKAHINMFSKNIIVILDALLVDISDYDIVRHCQVVFSSFCTSHDGSTLGADVEFRTLYFRVVARLADLARLGGENNSRYRVVGLKALENIVSSEAFHAGDYKAHVDFVLPPILDCLIDAKEGIQVILERHIVRAGPSSLPSASVYAATISEKDITEDDVTMEALQSLDALFNSQNGVHIKHSLESAFYYLGELGSWWPSSRNVGIIKAILNPVQPHFRYMVVSEIIAAMDNIDSTTSDMMLRLHKKVTLIAALNAILYSHVTLVGMPVLEVLNSLLANLTKSLSDSATLSKEGDASQFLVLETLIQDDLVRCIGGLATHIYYSNQVPHIISNIVGKLSFKLGATPQPETIESVPTVDYRKALLRCLTAVIKTSRDRSRQGPNVHASEISSELLTPCLGLLLDDNMGVRTSFALALITFLATEDDSQGQGNLLHSPLPASSSDLYFRSALHQTLHAYARLPTTTPTDMAAIYGILRALFTHFQDDEFMRIVPVLFSLQDWCLKVDTDNEALQGQELATLVTRKRALATVIVIFLQKAVACYGMEEPREYLDNIQASRESESQWHSIYYENQESLTRTTGHQWETASEPLYPVLTHPLAREHLITLLTTVSDRFRAGAERFSIIYNPDSKPTPQASKELGSMLFVPSPGNAQQNKSERGSDNRIRVSRHLEDWALPSIVPRSSGPPSVLTSLDESGEPSTSSTPISHHGSFILNVDIISNHSQRSIGVDNLKAALTSTQFMDDTGSSIMGSEIRSVPSGAKRFYLQSGQRLKNQHLEIGSSSASVTSNLATSRPDLADLLNTIQVTAPATNTHHSVVTPPYS